MRWTLRNQILLPTAGVMLLTIAGVSVLNAWFAARRAKAELETELRGVARTLVDSTFPLTPAVLRQTRGLSGAEFAVTDVQGNVVAASREGLVPPQPDAPRSPVDELTLGRAKRIGEAGYFHAAALLARRGPADQPLTLHILYPESRWSAAWRASVVPPLLVGTIALGVMLVLAAFVAARVTRPMARLREQVNRIAAGEFRPMQLEPRSDEIRDLADAVNRMAEMLARYEYEVRRNERLRTLGQLGGGLAHQLRNQVTGARMALDLHRRECSAAQDEESLDVAKRQLMLIENYVRQFLQLGKENDAPPAPVPLAQLIESVVPLLEPVARHRGVDLKSTFADPDMAVLGDFESLRELLVNLVLNGIDAAESGPASPERTEGNGQAAGIVTIEIGRENDCGLITVSDTGTGPPEHLQEELFEPLVSDKRDGAGLGLWVVRDVARRHHGAVTWDRRNGRTEFVVRLPLAEQPAE